MRPAVPILLIFMALVGVMSCSDPVVDPPAPATVLIAAEPEFAERALQLAEELLAPQGLAAALAPGDLEPHITVGSESEAGSSPFVTGYWVVVTGLSNEIRNVSLDSVFDTDLLEADDPSLPQAGWDIPLREIDLLVPDDPSPPLAEWGLPLQSQVMPVDAIIEAVRQRPKSLALLPLEAVDARVQSVRVGSANVVFREADTEYPLVERAWVSAAAHENPDFALILLQTKIALAKRLALDYTRPDPIILRATGDIIPARCVYAKHLEHGDFAHAFRELGPWLSEADITVGSLDASISDAGRPFGCTPTFSLLAPAQSVEGLTLAGLDVVTVATNHAKDCGMDACGNQAFFDTLDILRANGIEPVGGGADLAEARAPVVVDVRGTTFAFLGADQIAPYYHAAVDLSGVAPLDEAYLREDVRDAAAQADVVIVLPHWGDEYTNDPTANQQALAAAAAGAGADLVIGNHPHWVQAVDLIDETVVAYALGNFVFDQDWSVPTQQGVVLEAAFHGADLKGVRLLPIRIVDEHQPTFTELSEAQQVLDNIWSASERLP